MPLTTAQGLRDDCVLGNVGMGFMGPPEAPSPWGHNDGGYINDWPIPSPGGWQSAQGTYRLQPWFAILSPVVDNPSLGKCRVQLRKWRCYFRNRSTKAFGLVSGGGQGSPTGGDRPYARSYYRFSPQETRLISEFFDSPNGYQVAPSGGITQRMVTDWAIHGYEYGMVYPDFGLQDCFATVLQARIVPIDDSIEYAWSAWTAGLNVGSDNYNSGFVAEHTHGRFKKLTNRWQTFCAATTRRPNGTGAGDKPNQGPGITDGDFLSTCASLVPDDEEIWLERGAYSAGTNTQTLVLRRSAPTATNKSYSLLKRKGEFSGGPSSVVMTAGTTSVQFQVTVPGSPSGAQQILYITDGSSEDHWGDFVIGNGSSTGEPGGGDPGGVAGDYTRTNLLLRSGDCSISPWSLEGGSADTPDGNGWQLLTNGSDYIRQSVAGHNAGEPSTLQAEFSQGTASWVQLRISSDDWSSGCHQFVNLTTGELGQGTVHGAASGLSCVVSAVPGGGYRVRLTVSMPATTRRALVKAAGTGDSWDWESALTIYARRWMFQTGPRGTNHIPTTASTVTRTLTSVAISGSASVAPGSVTSGTVTLSDNASVGWDQFADIEVASSAPEVVSVGQPAGETNAVGQVTFLYTAVSAGPANLSAVGGDVVSGAYAVTVSGSAVFLDPPAAPVVSVVNSDTLSVSVGSVDSDATHVVIEGATSAKPGVFIVLAMVPVGSLPATITGLDPGTTYTLQARATVGSMTSVAGPGTVATTKRLFVEAYASTRALNQTGVDIQVFRPAPSGRALPVGARIAYLTNQTFGAAAVVVAGIQQAPIRAELSAQTDPPLRDGDRLSAIVTLNAPRRTTQATSNAVVVEA